MTVEDDDLDAALRAAAAEDADVVVPAHVEARVMRAWDERAARPGAARPRRWVVAACVAIPAAAVLALAVVTPPRTDAPDRPSPAPGVQAESVGVGPGQAPPSAARPLPARTRDVAATPAGRHEAAGDFVLVPDAFADATTLQVMRVRMSRAAFASLGLPMPATEGDGVIEVEVIVGDDGVARAIRRTAFVESHGQGGSR